MADLPKVGIDIGSTHIKLVELVPTGKGKWKMTAAGVVPAPAGGVTGGAGNTVAVAQLLAKTVREMGGRSRRVVAALPEDQVSSHVVEMPMMSDDEVKQALQWQVEQYIPIPADKAIWSHEVIKKDQAGGGMEVLLVAVAKSLVETYTGVLEQAGLEVVALETELMAAVRAVTTKEMPLALVVELGAKGTDLGVVNQGQLVFARTIPVGGEAFRRAVETELGLDANTAEQYKNTYGFVQDKLEGKVAGAMKPVASQLAGEIKKTVDFYTSKHMGETVKTVVLSGGGAIMPETAGMLSGLVGVEMAVGNPLARISMEENLAKALSSQAPMYAVACGLAMRPL